MACLSALNMTTGVANFNRARRRLGGAYLPFFSRVSSKAELHYVIYRAWGLRNEIMIRDSINSIRSRNISYTRIMNNNPIEWSILLTVYQ